jgi:membrane protein YdbS with pleckstrin-like domain
MAVLFVLIWTLIITQALWRGARWAWTALRGTRR